MQTWHRPFWEFPWRRLTRATHIVYMFSLHAIGFRMRIHTNGRRAFFFARPLLESVTNPPQLLNKGLRHPWGRSFSSLTSHIRNDEWQYVVAINLIHHPDKQDGVFPICVQQRGTQSPSEGKTGRSARPTRARQWSRVEALRQT